MYLQNLKLTKDVNQYLTNEQNKQLESFITLQYPDTILSIEDIAYRLNTDEDNVENVLILLSEYKVVDPLFVLRCDNEYFDNVHTFKFHSFETLSNFININNTKCPECDSLFTENNVEVFFVLPSAKIKKVKDND